MPSDTARLKPDSASAVNPQLALSGQARNAVASSRKYFSWIAGVMILASATNVSPWEEKFPSATEFTTTVAPDSALRQVVFLSLFFLSLAPLKSGLLSRFLSIPASLFLIFILFWLSAIWSFVPDVTFKRATLTAVVAITVFSLSRTLSFQESVRNFFKIGILLAITSLLTIIAWPERGIHQDFEEASIVGAWRGVFASKNSLGPVSFVFLLVSIHLRAANLSAVRPVFLTLSIILHTTLLIGSQSKTAIGFSAISLAFYFLFLAIRSRPSSTALGAISRVAMVAFLTIATMIVVYAFFTAEITQSSFTNRGMIWRSVYEIFSIAPYFGAGYGAIFSAGPNSAIYLSSTESWVYGLTQSHSAYLEILASNGIIGALLLVAIVAILAPFTVLKSGNLRPGDSAFVLALFVFVLLHAFLECSLADRARFTWLAFMWFWGSAMRPLRIACHD